MTQGGAGGGVAPPGGDLPPALTPEQAAELADSHGLRRVGGRPPLGRYVRDLWRRRSFLLTLSVGNFIARHQNNVLGLLWSVLNPLLMGAAYWFVFGYLLPATRGNIENYILFLTTGLFTFIYLSGGMNYGGRSLQDNVSLVRSLRFPRAILPLSVSITQFLASVPAFGMLLIIAVATGETPSLKWLLMPVAVLIVSVITTGIALIAARVVHEVRDASNLIPLLTRLLRYVSGVFFPIAYFAQAAVEDRGAPQLLAYLMEYQPVAVALSLVRETLLTEMSLDATTWIVATGWAVVLFGGGFLIFWRAEATYGRS